jgi:hypothetical protein
MTSNDKGGANGLPQRTLTNLGHHATPSVVNGVETESSASPQRVMARDILRLTNKIGRGTYDR